MRKDARERFRVPGERTQTGVVLVPRCAAIGDRHLDGFLAELHPFILVPRRHDSQNEPNVLRPALGVLSWRPFADMSHRVVLICKLQHRLRNPAGSANLARSCRRGSSVVVADRLAEFPRNGLQRAPRLEWLPILGCLTSRRRAVLRPHPAGLRFLRRRWRQTARLLLRTRCSGSSFTASHCRTLSMDADPFSIAA